MHKRALYVIGEPGVGKTTTLNRAIEDTGWLVTPYSENDYGHALVQDKRTIVGLFQGRMRERFGGTDALSMSVQPRIIERMQMAWYDHYPLAVGEGDRLATTRYFTALSQNGFRVIVIYMHAAPGVIAARRNERGGKQNDAWLRGRATKVNRLVEWCEKSSAVALVRIPSDHYASTRLLKMLKGETAGGETCR